MEIEGRTFLISGGGSGLGAATAQRLCADGGQVVVADINTVTGAAVAAAIGANARFVQMDASDEAGVRGAIRQAIESFGGLHGAINCAGIAAAERTLGRQGVHTLASFTRILQVNLVGSFNVARLAAEVMALNPPNDAGERGVILNTASIAAFDGQIGQAAYAASKGGIVSLTLPLARDLAGVGIRVMTIAPGIFDTPLLAGLPEPARVSLGQQVPFPPRLGQPAEFAALVAHVIENPMLNGEVIRLDGAVRLAQR